MQELDQAKVHVLMREKEAGNYNRFARKLGVDPSHLYRFIKTGNCGGRKIILAFMNYCKKNELDFDSFLKEGA